MWYIISIHLLGYTGIHRNTYWCTGIHIACMQAFQRRETSGEAKRAARRLGRGREFFVSLSPFSSRLASFKVAPRSSILNVICLERAVIVVTFWVCVARLCLRLLSPEERCKFHHNLFVLSSSGSPTVLRVMRVLLVSGCCYIGHYIGIIYSGDIIMYDIWSTYLQNGAQNQVSIV